MIFMEKKVLSVVIPTYNMETLLERCLYSLVIDSAILSKVEIIVVNDGSKDSSLLIASEFQKKYPESTIIIDKENGNYGSCINQAIKQATGKYIKILDADDSFVTSSFRSFVQNLNHIDADMILTDFMVYNQNSKTSEVISYKDMYGISSDKNIPVDSFFAEYPNYYGRMHGVTYRLSLLRQMGYHQTEGISYTDQEWVLYPMKYIKNIYYLHLPLYIYNIGREGQTIFLKSKCFDQLVFVTKKLCDFYENNINDHKKLINYYYNQIFKQVDLIYYLGLFEDFSLSSKVRSVDEYLKSHSLYGMTNELTRCRIKYVKLWRLCGYSKLPKWYLLLERIVKKIVKSKI